jgi:DNA-binding response OmpR family regulator
MFDASEYDLAILDIMGVDGYGLLEIAKEKNIPAIMLTAHALSEEDLLRSAEQGAAYYAPKEELVNIKAIVAEVIDAIENKKSTWERMFDRLAGFYDRQFNGTDWREKQKEFWEKKIKTYI